MKKEVFEIDINGYIAEKYVADFDDQGKCTEELTENFIITDMPQGLYRAKWTGTEWIEDMSQAEIDALNNQPKEPTATEIQEMRISDLEMAIAEMLGGVI